LQTGLALGEVALNQGDHPASRDPVLAGNLTFTTSFDQHGHDHQLRHSHRSTLVVGCERCLETGVNDLLNSDTLSSTRETGSSADYSEPFDDNFDDNWFVFDDNRLIGLSPTCAKRQPIESSASRCTASIDVGAGRHRDGAVTQNPLHRRRLHTHGETGSQQSSNLANA
jgi:hypothetical protein